MKEPEWKIFNKYLSMFSKTNTVIPKHAHIVSSDSYHQQNSLPGEYHAASCPTVLELMLFVSTHYIMQSIEVLQLGVSRGKKNHHSSTYDKG